MGRDSLFKAKSIDDLICNLLEEDIIGANNEIVFTERSIELIHKIAEKSNNTQIVRKTQEQAEEYAKNLTAEQIYLDMLRKIVEAPTNIHMEMSARMLIPLIDKKLQERDT